MKKKSNNNIDWFKALFWGGFLILSVDFWIIVNQTGYLFYAIIIYLLSAVLFAIAVIEEIR